MSVQYTEKRNGLRVCGDTGVVLNGIPRLRNGAFSRVSRRVRTVSRPYGGSLSHEAVRHRIMRAFFNEELRVIKQGATAVRRAKKRVGGQRKK